MKLPPMTSYYHAPLRLSLLVPVGWQGQALNEAHLRLFAPPEPQFDEYQATMSYQFGYPEGYGPDWMDAVVRDSESALHREYAGYKLLNIQRSTLSCQALLFVRYFEWQEPETQLHFAQLQAFIRAGDAEMYLVNAAALYPLRNRYLPVFACILNSTRIIPRGEKPS